MAASFDADQRLERHNLWAARIDRLMAVEDFNYSLQHPQEIVALRVV